MKFTPTILLSFFFFSATAQIDPPDSIYISTIVKQGTIMTKALLAKDYVTFAKYTNPTIVKMAGGEDKMIGLIRSQMEKYQLQGFTILDCSVESPLNIIHSHGALQCILLENLEMKVPTGRITTSSVLIGISNDKGKNWTFIETQGKDLKTMKESIRDLSDVLVIPKVKKPVMIKD